jgi:DNA-binding transcriptional LysR family regulator
MDLQDIALFIRVAELGSLSAAARERDVPVSQVSRALARLEAGRQLRLLHRTTHALSLTEAGQALLEHGRRMLQSWADFDAEVGDANQVSGTVQLAVSAAMAQYVIVPSLPQLAKRHPQLGVELHVDDRIVDMAREGIDLAIRTGVPGTDRLVARQIGQHGRKLYAAPSYLRAYGQPKDVAALEQHRLITNSAQPALNRWPFNVRGQAVVHVARGHWRANSTNMMMNMALLGMGIVRGNTAICEPLVASDKLALVLDKLVHNDEVPIYAVMLQERHRAPKIRACIEFFAQWLAGEAT